jgi:hypothetical protein
VTVRERPAADAADAREGRVNARFTAIRAVALGYVEALEMVAAWAKREAGHRRKWRRSV